ncbi:MAG: ABC transporter ATP-binding protein [Gemmatimonadota bacterium]
MSDSTQLDMETAPGVDSGETLESTSSPSTWKNGALIRLRQITRIYKEGSLEVLALRGVDLDVAEGEFSALAGPSGSGKTTLLNIIGVLDHPTSGRVEVAGRDIGKLQKGEAADFRLNHVGFIFQAYNLVPVLTAYENAEFTLLLRGIPPQERKDRVMPLLERVGLADMADRKPHELSGGQQQRVAVVRALATRPAIILADEPTANLDSDTSAGLLDLMQGLNEEMKTTFLFSTHDPVVIGRARRVIRLLDGRVTGSEAVAAD